MPNISQMNIGIGTNLGALEQGLSRASKKISSFSAGVEKRLGSISTQRLQKGLSGISAKGVPAADKLASSMGNLQSPVRGSTSAVINFNRVIQDAPFGILGVANNLEPLANSFNQLKSQTGSATGALTTLLKSAFTGPGALITVVSVASSLLIVFQQRMRGAGGASKEAKEQIEGVVEAADNLNDVLSQDTGFADKIQQDIDRNKQAIQLAKERRDIEEQINLASITVGSGMTESQRRHIQLLEEEKEATNDLINTLGFEDTELEKLQGNLRKLEKQQEIYNGTIGTSETRIAAFVDRLEGEAQQAIDNYQAGITDTTDEIEEQRTEVGNLLRSMQSLARNGNEEARQAAVVLMNVWNDLNSELDDGTQKAVQVDTTWKTAIPTLDKAKESADKLAKSIGKMPEMGISADDMAPSEGSIAALEMQVQAMENMRRILPPTSQGFKELTGLIAETRNKLNQLGQEAEETGNETENVGREGAAGMAMLADATGGVVGQLIRGKKEALSFGNILSSVLPALANVIFPGSGTGAKFARGLFGGIFHQGGTVPGALGQERLILAQGGETIRTPKQERALGKGGGGKTVIHTHVMVGNRQIAQATNEYNEKLSR